MSSKVRATNSILNSTHKDALCVKKPHVSVLLGAYHFSLQVCGSDISKCSPISSPPEFRYLANQGQRANFLRSPSCTSFQCAWSYAKRQKTFQLHKAFISPCLAAVSSACGHESILDLSQHPLSSNDRLLILDSNIKLHY